MRKTYCEARMMLLDVTALEDSTAVTDDNIQYANISLLKENIVPKSYVTTELNWFILDGSKSYIDDKINDVAFVSDEMSNADCEWDIAQKVTISFTENHTSEGITLYFNGDYPKEIKITWYTISGTKIISKVFYPNSMVFACKQQVINYGKIEIEFLKSRFPFQYAKLQYVIYGLIVEWNKSTIKSANIVEEVDYTGATLSINTAKISILDQENEFDSMNENGAWKSIQKTQEMTITEYVNDKPIPMGTFYVDTHGFSNNVASFSLIDAIGLMSKYKYSNGGMYKNEKAGIILEDIFKESKITKYLIDDEVYNIELTGTLEIQTCREALQMVCFACGCIADDSRSDTIHVYKPSREVRYTIPITRKFNGKASVGLSEYVSGISIEYNDYSLDVEETEIFSNTLKKGISRIEFSEPYKSDTITASFGTVLEAKTNYLIIDMPEEKEVVITGFKFAKHTFAFSKSVERLDANETENTKSFGECTLYNAKILEENATALLDYYSLRKSLDMEFVLEDEQSGNWMIINDRNSRQSISLLASQSVDLANGFTSKAKCIGYSTIVTDYSYLGEFYMGEGGLI